ncbi:MAG: extracellular solute-binding protein [Rubricoccaceae bacterium]
MKPVSCRCGAGPAGLLTALALALLFALGGCASDAPSDAGDGPGTSAGSGELVVYAGRRDVLVGPLVERFQRETGLRVDVRYGTDAEMLATLQEEGAASRADLFWANTAGALGAAAEAGLLAPLPDSLTARPTGFVPSSGRWVPLSARFRVLAYNAARVNEAQLPASVMALPRQANLRGRIGWTPTYSSFQDFVTAMRTTQGEDAARAWLDGMRALEPRAYPSNGPMIEALRAGEIDVALTNHYYVLRALFGADADPSAPPIVAIHSFADGDVGNLALVTGAGVLERARNREAAHRFLAFLLGAEAQRFFAEDVFEYPVVEATALPSYFVPAERVGRLSPALDFERLGDLEATLRLLRDAGLL